jgi:cytochrome c oxidase subunit 2
MNCRTAKLAVLFLGAGLLLIACGGNQSSVRSAGIQASRLESLWWLFFWITAAVYVLVMLVLLVGFFRNRRPYQKELPDIIPDPDREKRASRIVSGAVAVTVVVLLALMLTSFRTGAAINSLSESPELAVKVTGHQWWWEVEYQDEDTPANNVVTANEIHIPVGRTVKLILQSNDVIHSLWIPNLHGKKDLIPIYPTTFYFRADKPGVYWGQCAEFCGYQHAKMRIILTAESDEDFQKYLNAGRQVPAIPTENVKKRGEEIFTTSACAQCHTVAGTGAGGRVGPDLTHIANRPYIAAGSLPNTPENLASWITDPQKIKPGIKMPQNLYSDDDLRALVTYLESLK